MTQRSKKSIPQTVGIITGDIIHSTAIPGSEWVLHLQEALQNNGQKERDWTMFAGDSFQIRITDPSKSIHKAIFLYAEMYGKHEIKLRQSIGIGEIEYDSDKLSTSNGSAFRRSGRGLEQIGKQKIMLSSPWKDFDTMARTMIALAEKIMDDWTSRMAYILFEKMKQPHLKQKELAKILGVRQSVISESLTRSGYKEISGMLQYLEKQIQTR